MKFLWCDTETTGLDVENAAPFQIAFIFVYSDKNNKEEFERVFYLNPLDMNGIEFNKTASEIHGYTETDLKKFDPSSEVVYRIYNYLKELVRYRDDEKLVFVGYNEKFDFEHLASLFRRNGFDFTNYFSKRIDVLEQVRKANHIFRSLPNRKLTTVAKFLGIDFDLKAHDALSDIKVTREVAKSLAQKKVPLF